MALHTPALQHVMQLVVLVQHVVRVCVNYVRGDEVFPDKESAVSSHHASFLSTIFRVFGRVVHNSVRTYIYVCVQTSQKPLLCDNSLCCVTTSMDDFLLFAVLPPIQWLRCCPLASQARPLLPLLFYILTMPYQYDSS